MDPNNITPAQLLERLKSMTVEEAAEVIAGVQTHFGETQPFQDDDNADIHIERNTKNRLTYQTIKLYKPLPFSITDERSFDEWLNGSMAQ